MLTGVTGYLGSHLAKTFLTAGYSVIALKRKFSSLRRIDSIKSKMLLLDVESIDFKKLFYEFGQIDFVIHTATCYGRNGESATEIFSVNTEFPLLLLDSANQAGVKFFLNTDTVLDKYLNMYSLSKNQFLEWGKMLSRQNRISFVNIRLEHFYGFGESSTKFSAYVIKSCIENVPELKLTKGDQTRDFIYIDDVVSAYKILLEKADSFSSSLVQVDVGTGKSVSIRDFVATVHRLSHSKTYLDFGAIPQRDGELMNSVANITLMKALGWNCNYDIELGLAHVIEQEIYGLNKSSTGDNLS